MIDLLKAHELIYLFLSKKREDNPKLYYSFRKSNHAGRLEDGYWFYGNDDYLAISFWSGMDWKNRTPNIVFMINKIGDCFLEINFSDSTRKMEFIKKEILPRIDGIEESGRRYCKFYSNSNLDQIEEVLDEFLSTDKVIIDNILEENESFLKRQLEEDEINFILPKEFLRRKKNVDKYREIKDRLEKGEKYTSNEIRVTKIKSLFIKKYGFVNNFKLEIDDSKNQWVFITGENGSGKTNLLRAIAAFLGQKNLSIKDIRGGHIDDFKIEAELWHKNDIESFVRNGNNKISTRPITQGLAMYGPYRLDIIDELIPTNKFKKKLGKIESFKSLFDTGEKLLNIDKQFSIWRSDNLLKFEKMEYFIRSILTDIVPELVNIKFEKDSRNRNKTIYEISPNENVSPQKLGWEELSSGTKSIFALIGDILIRLHNQQKNVLDPSEFKGIVIIDEIDLHLHPQAQKDLIINLSKTFYNIQFIVSTHSPIPLLGANENSVFYKVEKNNDKVEIQRLRHIEKYIGELMPNQLLTSDLFGLDSLISIRNKERKNIFTGSTMSDFYETKELVDKNILKDPDNSSFLEKLKSRLNEKG